MPSVSGRISAPPCLRPAYPCPTRTRRRPCWAQTCSAAEASSWPVWGQSQALEAHHASTRGGAARARSGASSLQCRCAARSTFSARVPAGVHVWLADMRAVGQCHCQPGRTAFPPAPPDIEPPPFSVFINGWLCSPPIPPPGKRPRSAPMAIAAAPDIAAPPVIPADGVK